MTRPMLSRMKTTSHCIPEKPVFENSFESITTLLSHASSLEDEPDEPAPSPPHTSTLKLISEDEAEVQRLIGQSGTKLIEKCCGGGCCKGVLEKNCNSFERVKQPDNEAYRALGLNIDLIPINLSNVPEIPSPTVSILPIRNNASPDQVEALGVQKDRHLDTSTPCSVDDTSDADYKLHPPDFVKPHHPFSVYSARLFNARELTRPGAEKRTYHFDLDVTDYPRESGVDFKVGGAIGVCASNNPAAVDDLLKLLCIPRYLWDRPILLNTTSGRWPTVWGDDQARELITTRWNLLTWCSDIQSYPPTKLILRLLAEYASSEAEKKILLFLTSAEGQSAFCNLRTGPHITIPQLLHAFPSSQPPLEALLSQLQQLMPRFYSLSNDPYETFTPATGSKRLIEIAVTVHKSPNWDGTERTGVGSGYLERLAREFIKAEENGIKPDLRVPMFKGLMANPLAREFVSDGPMLLVGAGVGVAPFRGFVQRRLRNANCVNKVWVLQGVRDSLLDELYTGEWGLHESEVKKVVQSRWSTGPGKYVQDEVRAQADLVWFIINSLDGRIFVCGSNKGMGEGVHKALVEVAMAKGNLDEEEAESFWEVKKKAGQYVAETW